LTNRVLVFSAHPDDEVLGCGGAIAHHRSKSDPVGVCYLSEGISSRFSHKQFLEPSLWKELQKDREEMASAASKILDFEILDFLRLPNLRMEDQPLLDIVKSLITIISNYDPHTVYVNHPGDLNTDHRVTFDAVYTALRPAPNHNVKIIRTYEVLSSTEWAPNINTRAFVPDTFIDISNHFKQKIDGVRAYGHEMRPPPHPRSEEVIRSLASYRGAQAGQLLSEAFVTIRQLLD